MKIKKLIYSALFLIASSGSAFGSSDSSSDPYSDANERFRYRGLIGLELSQNPNKNNTFSQSGLYLNLIGRTLWMTRRYDNSEATPSDPYGTVPAVVSNFSIILGTSPAEYKTTGNNISVADFSSLTASTGLELRGLNFDHSNLAKHQLFVSPIINGGLQTINNPSVTKRIGKFWNVGLRFGEQEVMLDMFDTPMLRSYLDITAGRYGHLGAWAYAAEGFLDIPQASHTAISVKTYWGRSPNANSVVLRISHAFDFDSFVAGIAQSVTAIAHEEKDANTPDQQGEGK